MKKLCVLLLLLTLSGYSQIDSTYYYDCKKILEHYPKSRITAESLYHIANEVNDSLGIIVPYELALSQAVVETSLGSAGVGKSRNNPYSINSRNGYIIYNNVDDGVRVYYYLMARKYLKCRTQSQLLQKFVNCNNRRYASYEGYELKCRNQIIFFHKLLNKR